MFSYHFRLKLVFYPPKGASFNPKKKSHKTLAEERDFLEAQVTSGKRDFPETVGWYPMTDP